MYQILKKERIFELDNPSLGFIGFSFKKKVDIAKLCYKYVTDGNAYKSQNERIGVYIPPKKWRKLAISIALGIVKQGVNGLQDQQLWLNNNQRVKDGTNTYKDDRYADSLVTAINRGGMFDSRCFNIPREEVTNYFYWRQLDATRNSIESVGQHYFSQRELHGKNCNEIQDMLYDQKDVNWNDYSAAEKRGTCCIKTDGGWVIDAEIPIFKGTGRIYIDKYIDEELDERDKRRITDGSKEQ